MNYRPSCIEDRCRSPLACTGFGYCRSRNDDGLPTAEQAAAWRALDAPIADGSRWQPSSPRRGRDHD
ncbi:hypothetical protein, partial [Klebsiella pneumoniae]